MNEQIRTATVDLYRIDNVDGILHIVIKGDFGCRQFSCRGRDLTTFDRFQARVADATGLWADHPSQIYVTAYTRRVHWKYAVGKAFNRGCNFDNLCE